MAEEGNEAVTVEDNDYRRDDGQNVDSRRDPARWKPSWTPDEQRRADSLHKALRRTDQYTTLTARGVRPLYILSGPPGLGKSTFVEDIIARHHEATVIARITGRITAWYTYRILAEQHDGFTLVDDADSAWTDPQFVDIMKQASERRPVRRIHWGTSAAPKVPTSLPAWPEELLQKLRDNNKGELPKTAPLTYFEFTGSVVAITNLNLRMEAEKAPRKLGLHALLDRANYQDLGHSTGDIQLLWCERLNYDERLLEKMGLGIEQETEVMSFLRREYRNAHAMSIRLMVKIAEHRRDAPDYWLEMAADELRPARQHRP